MKLYDDHTRGRLVRFFAGIITLGIAVCWVALVRLGTELNKAGMNQYQREEPIFFIKSLIFMLVPATVLVSLSVSAFGLPFKKSIVYIPALVFMVTALILTYHYLVSY